MKRVWIAVALLAVVVGLCGAGTLYRHRQTEGLLSTLDQLERAYTRDDMADAQRLATELVHRYERISDVLLCYTAHGDMAESMETVRLLPTLLEQGGGEELSMEIARLREEWSHLKAIDDPTMWNIL